MGNEDRPKIWGQLSPEVYEYFFRKIFAGDRGIKQQLINHFFTALYEECKRQRIKAEWNPESGKQIESIMDNINFHAHRPRRPAHSPTKHKAQSPTRPDERSTVEGVRDPTADPNRET